MADTADEVLIAQAKAGDVESFSELVRRHERIVYNLAYRYMRETTAAEDMAQESFLKAFRLLEGFRGDSKFSTWMYRVTCSVCLTELSKRKRRNEVALQPHHRKQMAESPKVETSDLPELVRRCVDMLPDNYSTIITLYYLEGVSYDDIAEVMEIPLGTLKTWMHRARKQLKEIVKKESDWHET